MKLSCLPVSIYHELIAKKIYLKQWVTFAQECELDAVDLSVLILRAYSLEELEEMNLALPVDTIAAYTDFTHPSDEYREAEYQQFLNDLQLAAKVNAKYMRITAGQAYPETSATEGIELAYGYFQKAVEAADELNIKLLFENHSRPGVWEYYDFAGKPEVYFNIIDRMKNIDIDLLFDTANSLVYHQNPVEMLKLIQPKVKRIHLNDIKVPGKLECVCIGEGVVDFSEFFTFLKHQDYQGNLSIEEASFQGMNGIKKAVEATKHLWKQA